MVIFEAELQKDENGRLTFLAVPFHAREVFSIPKGTIYVKGCINDVEYRSKLLSCGQGKFVLVLNKALQKQIGFQGGSLAVKVTMCLDQEPAKNQNKQNFEPASSQIDVITAIQNRHSIRKFTSKDVDEGLLNTIINAGLQAPTAKNKRPCHFIIIKDKKMLEKLGGHNSNAAMLAKANCGIIVCGDSNLEGTKEFLYEDCAAASQNILLCCHGLGLGAVWCGVAKNSEWKKLIIDELELPLKVDPVSVIALGYPNEYKETENRWDINKIHYHKW